MKLFRSGIIAALLLVSFPNTGRAQLTMTGGDPPLLKWSSITTKDYKVIYPRGLDSLALIYGQKLQYYNKRVGLSAGMFPNEAWRKPMPVILHAYNADFNGMVTVAPRRMELFTVPDPTASLTPVPGETVLAIHENRHVAQTQFAREGAWKYTYWPFGELSTLAVSALYETRSMFEGDAVVAETALTRAGRGRSADFLGYMRMCFDQGDIRNWYRWNYGSIKHNTPDVYRVGYITVAGVRVTYGAPMYMAHYLDGMKSVWGIDAMRQSTSYFSRKSFKKTWPELAETFHQMWEENDSLRAPFTEAIPVVDKRRMYVSYSSSVALGGNIYSVKAGMDYSPRIVRIEPDGTENNLCFYGGGMLEASERNNALYWQETISSPFWSMKQDSRIVRYDLGSGKKTYITKKGRYFNPSVSPSGKVLCVTELPIEGGSAIVLLDAATGERLGSWKSPAGHQVMETVLYDDCVYFNSLSEDGIRLYKAALSGNAFGEVEECLPPTTAAIKNLGPGPDGGVVFISDRTGQSDAYLYDGTTLKQLSSTKYGLGWPVYLGRTLYASVQGMDGRLLSKVPVEERPAAIDEVWKNTIADKLSNQEKALQANALLPEMEETPVSEPAKYSRLGHAIKIHSWAPVYCDLSGFKSYYSRYETASPGAMVLFQNDLGTLGGSLGVSAHSQVFEGSKVAPVGGHLRLTYSGLWPELSLKLNVGDRASATMTPYHETNKDSVYVKYTPSDKAYIGGKVSAYFPLDLSSGAWTRNLSATVSFSASNDKLYSPYIEIDEITQTETKSSFPVISDSRSMEINLEGSSVIDKMPAQLSKTRGGGFSLSYKRELHYDSYSGTVYGYLPGITSTQGLTLSASASINDGFCFSPWPSSSEVLIPRGLDKVTGLEGALSYKTKMMKFSADYSIPCLRVDWALDNFSYLRNGELLPFADFTAYKSTMGLDDSTKTLWSVGANVAFHFERLFWISLPLNIGVRLSYNGGTGIDALKNDIPGLNRFTWSLIFEPVF